MRPPSRRQFRRALQAAAMPPRARPPIVRTLGAPTGGLNGRDAWDDMDPLDALRMVNMFPGYGKVSVRGGSLEREDLGTAMAVETLATLNSTAGAFFFAASNGSIWNITTPGTPVEHGSGTFTTDRWQTANMNDVLVFVNGSNTPQQHDGSSLSTLTVTGMSGTAIGVNVFKSRSYFWADNSQDFYYSAVNALGGAVTLFPLADVGSFGGELMTMVTWTRDGGAGVDDFAVFIMSSGDTIVYAGSNPGDASDWSLVGVFRMGAPLGRRSAIKIGGDALILTVDGPVLLSKILPGGRAARGTNISDKLGRLFPDQARLTGSSFGWQPLLYPFGTMALINYPTGGEFEQWAVNSATGAWGGPFRGMDANCWALFQDRPFFGTSDGRVMEFDTGVTDDGEDILWDMRPAFNYLGSRSQNKNLLMVSPLLEAAAAVPITIGIATDFAAEPQATINAEIGVAGGQSTPWGSPWGSPWSTPSKTVEAWLGAAGRGYAVSAGIAGEQTDKRIAYNAIRVAYQPVEVVI